MEEVLAMDSINREGYRDGDNGGQKDNQAAEVRIRLNS